MEETTGEQRPAKQAGLLKSFVAGGFGGVCNVLVGYPLDTIKVYTALGVVAREYPFFSFFFFSFCAPFLELRL